MHNTRCLQAYDTEHTNKRGHQEGSLCPQKLCRASCESLSSPTNSSPQPLGRRNWTTRKSHQCTDGRWQGQDLNSSLPDSKAYVHCHWLSTVSHWETGQSQGSVNVCLPWFFSSWKWLCSHSTRRATRNQIFPSLLPLSSCPDLCQDFLLYPVCGNSLNRELWPQLNCDLNSTLVRINL